MMLFLFQNKANEIFWTPPPPKQKNSQGYERSRYGYTHKCLSIPAACDLNFYYVDTE